MRKGSAMNQTEKYRRRSLGVPEWSRLPVKKVKKKFFLDRPAGGRGVRVAGSSDGV